jgi:hypothetical protein
MAMTKSKLRRYLRGELRQYGVVITATLDELERGAIRLPPDAPVSDAWARARQEALVAAWSWLGPLLQPSQHWELRAALEAQFDAYGDVVWRLWDAFERGHMEQPEELAEQPAAALDQADARLWAVVEPAVRQWLS